MTTEKLLNCSADEMEKFTDQQLLAYFAPYLDITRPDRAAIKQAADKAISKSRAKTGKVDPALEAISRLTQFGINFDKI